MVAEKKVGIRELKAKLSGYIQEVKKGHTLIITERGRTVGRMLPNEESLEDRVQSLIRSGVVSWNGKRLKPGRPSRKLKAGARTIAQLVSENRE